MRLKEKTEDIDYRKTQSFFDKRAGKFKENNPYSVTMYQDDHAELVNKRNEKEVKKLKPLLLLDRESKVLDIACGIGRWADAITEDISRYCGVDFCGELIEIAKKRNKKKNFFFYEGAATKTSRVLKTHRRGRFNKILLIGILVYLNDRDLIQFMNQLELCCEPDCRICIREPIGIKDRLTLIDFYSEELKDSYNAIYRTREELNLLFEKTLFLHNFRIEEQGFLFDEDELNNREETLQYYYILTRKTKDRAGQCKK